LTTVCTGPVRSLRHRRRHREHQRRPSFRPTFTTGNAVGTQSGVLSVTFTAYAGHTYQLRATDNLAVATLWENVGNPVVVTGAPVTMTDSKPIGAKRFCRIRLDP
jgi:hypothetical protein